MKFSANGLYIEEYRKCANCGYLIYETDMENAVTSSNSQLFCSKWCLDWKMAKTTNALESR